MPVASFAAVMGILGIGLAWRLAAATLGGLGGWLALLPMVFQRLIVCERIAPRIVPSLFLIASAPAVFAGSWLALNGARADAAFRSFAFQSFFAVPLVLRLAVAIGNAPFSIAWWGFTFPASALASAALEYDRTTPSGAAAAIALTALVVATAVILWVGVRQLEAVREQLRRPAAPATARNG